MEESIEERIRKFVTEIYSGKENVIPKFGVYDYGLLKRIYNKKGGEYGTCKNSN